MTTAAALAAGEAPSGPLYGEGLGLFLVASLAVILLAYGAVRLLGNWQIAYNRGRRLRVLEGVPVGRDRSLLLVMLGKEFLVVGSSPHGVQLVYRVADPETVAALAAEYEVREDSRTVPDPEPAIRQHLQAMRELLSRRGQRHDR